MLKKIKKWWNGEWETWNDSNSFGIGLNRHWTSKFAHWVVSLISNPEKRARLLAIIAVATFFILLAKNLSHSETNPEPANVNRDNGEPQGDITVKQNQ